MKDILSILVPTPVATGDEKWWPDLFLKKGRKLMQIQPEQCAAFMEKYVDGRGYSEMPRGKAEVPLFDIDGQRVGHISYNGRVWMEDGGQDIEIPVEGRKTCAQLDKEGWAK